MTPLTGTESPSENESMSHSRPAGAFEPDEGEPWDARLPRVGTAKAGQSKVTKLAVGTAERDRATRDRARGLQSAIPLLHVCCLRLKRGGGEQEQPSAK